MDPYYERRRGMPTWAIVLLSCGGCGCFALVALFGGAMFLDGRSCDEYIDNSDPVADAQEGKLIQRAAQLVLGGP